MPLLAGYRNKSNLPLAVQTPVCVWLGCYQGPRVAYQRRVIETKFQKEIQTARVGIDIPA